MKKISLFHKHHSANINQIAIDPKGLYEGCLLAAIAHAVTVGEYPELNYEHSWDGINYSMNDSQGCRGTISFDEHWIVAAFRDENVLNECKDASEFFKGAESGIKKLAEKETLQYLLADVNGVAKPVITTAFWGSWDTLYSCQSLDDFISNGGHILSNQLREFPSGLKKWDECYEFHDGQMELITSLYENKRNRNMCDEMHLTKEEKKRLYGEVDECVQSLRELNILVYES